MSEKLPTVLPTAELIPAQRLSQADARIPIVIIGAGEKALLSFVNFFTGEIENENTRAAYLRAWQEFGIWAAQKGVELHQVQPFVLAEYREKHLKGRYHIHTVKQHLSALRRVFDQMVIDQVIPMNPAAAVRGPKFSAKQGVTPVLSEEEIRHLFNSLDTSHLVGLRDRALLSVLVYAVARVGAATLMQVRDFYPQGRRWKVRLHEKGGKLHEVWAHHNLEEYLHAYIEAAGIGGEKTTPLFRSTLGKSRQLTTRGLDRRNVYDMIRRRSKEAGVNVSGLCCHTFRATGITLYMENGGALSEAQKLANHADPRTTKLYDRSGQDVSLDEIERIRF